MFKCGNRVIMLKNDGWAKKGWIGTIPPQKLSPIYGEIRVHWTNDKKFRHSKEDLKILNESNDPNIAFMLHKKG